jgi:hypothetical protein
MTVAQTPGAIEKFKRTSWGFQQTVEKPPGDLDKFVSAIICASGALEGGCLTVDQVIFEPENVESLFPATKIPQLKRDSSITTARPEETPALLRAALADPIDFIFISTPKACVIYGDHDEWVTFYANSKSGLNALILPLRNAGFKLIEDWDRTF